MGASINIGSRIVKLPGLACCFYRKGIEFEEGMSKDVSSTYLVKKVKVRGIGEEELVCVNKQKFERLDAADKEIYKDVRKG